MGSVQANPYVFNCRSWRAYRRGEGDLILKHTMNDAFATLKEKGVRSSEIRTALMNQRVELVLTAHPTQAVRRTMLHKLTAYALPRRKNRMAWFHWHLPGCMLAHAVGLCRLGELLAERDRTNLTPTEMADIRRRMKIEIVSAWGTNTVRRIKPTVGVRMPPNEPLWEVA